MSGSYPYMEWPPVTISPEADDHDSYHVSHYDSGSSAKSVACEIPPSVPEPLPEGAAPAIIDRPRLQRAHLIGYYVGNICLARRVPPSASLPEGIIFDCEQSAETIFDIEEMFSPEDLTTFAKPNTPVHYSPGDFDDRLNEPKGPDVFMREINNLGFLTLKGFLQFIYRKDISQLLRDELYCFGLGKSELTKGSKDVVLKKTPLFLARVEAKIKEAWKDPMVHDKLNRPKDSWRPEDFVARFALKLAALCDGKLAGLKHIPDARVVAWAAIELARVYLRMHPSWGPDDGRAVFYPDIKRRCRHPETERIMVRACKPSSSTILHETIQETLASRRLIRV
ncbi:hypothetical protein PT974_08118 [Cladobotryum mycophilum]|uniref:Uncharacterized protein n=1 Tax=Cladobotryum mycophilum TaxID=491253 RepID=A0ABR0SDW8_9HYPO